MGLESLSPIGLGIGAGTDLAKMLYGVFQMIHGNKKLNELQRPVYNVDQNILNNQALAGQAASQGFGNGYLNMAGDQSERAFGSTLGAINSTGQGLNNLIGAQSASNNNFQNFLMQDAMQKAKNREALYQANKDVRDENLRAFDWNKAQPFETAQQRYTQQSNAGAQNIFGGGQGLGADAIGLGDYFGSKLGSGNNGGGSNNNNQFLQQLQQFLAQYGSNKPQ